MIPETVCDDIVCTDKNQQGQYGQGDAVVGQVADEYHLIRHVRHKREAEERQDSADSHAPGHLEELRPRRPLALS